MQTFIRYCEKVS